ncbi:hypothetical protein [Leptospira alstonii]|uniref:hypothetical protein n=1 Tax=Leptospira alstonii TaxID=28452 RepID=UPI0007736388|nr:hypothetical protein [Leptospira alstonii]
MQQEDERKKHEFVIVAPAGGRLPEGRIELTTEPQPDIVVVHRFGERVGIAHGRDADSWKTLNGYVVERRDAPIDDTLLADLSPTERLGIEVFRIANRPRPEVTESERFIKVDAQGLSGCLDIEDEEAASLRGIPETNDYLEGSVTVVIVFVEGPTSVLQFTDGERKNIYTDIQSAVDWFATYRPTANLSFQYDINEKKIKEPADPSLPKEKLEDVWLVPVLKSLGYSSVPSLASAKRDAYQTRWAYCAFITRYPLYTDNGAYAVRNDAKLVVNPFNSNVLINTLPAAFRHETGHIFGAPDEYGDGQGGTPCKCGGEHGRYGVPNWNCPKCNPPGLQPCIMNNPAIGRMCFYTPFHLGWCRSWENLGGNFAGKPAVCSWGLNRLDICAIGIDGKMHHKSWGGTKWSPQGQGWEDLGGQFMLDKTPAVCSWGLDRLDICGIGTDGKMYHKSWGGTKWSPQEKDWEHLGGGPFASSPTVVSWGLNRFDIFAIGTDGKMYHKSWGGTEWSPQGQGWEDLGGQFMLDKNPTVVSWGLNRLDIFGVGINSSLYHRSWNGTEWYPPNKWEDLGGRLVSPAAVSTWAIGRLDIVALGLDNQMYRKVWDINQWIPPLFEWEKIDGIFYFSSPPAMVSWGIGRLDIMALGTDKQMYYRYYERGDWKPYPPLGPDAWDPRGGKFSSPPAIVSWGLNRLDVFALDEETGQMLHQAWDGTTWLP